MKLGSRSYKLSGPRLVGSAHVNASVVTPRVPNHQVCREDNHICGNGLPV